jgi:RNA polymerase-binding transcription factor DksA
LNEFKQIIEGKLVEAKEDLKLLRGQLDHSDDHGTDDTGRSFNMMEDGSETMSREEMAHLAVRQEKFIRNLENALIRIENKTYGICRVTGKLIQKPRLKLVPHATLSIEAKKCPRLGYFEEKEFNSGKHYNFCIACRSGCKNLD